MGHKTKKKSKSKSKSTSLNLRNIDGINKKLSEVEITTTKEVEMSYNNNNKPSAIPHVKFGEDETSKDEEKHAFRVQFADDIIFEILIWLPAKSLMRFKCVAKAWNTLIRHDPNFVKSHIARSHARPSATRLLFQLDISPPLPYEPSSNSPGAQLEERFPLQLAPHHYSDRRVVYDICSNQCNGLVCLYDFYRHKSQIYLYNITTGEIKALPSSLLKVFEYSKVHILYLGFDPITENYKLLYVSDEFEKKIKILTLGTNSWREIKLIPLQSSPNFSRHCVFLNGLLYWNERYWSSPVDYFDFREEKFGILSTLDDFNPWQPLPKDFNKQTTNWYWCSPLRGRYEKGYFISDDDEVNKDLMKYNSDNSNLAKVASLVEVERSNIPKIVFATTSFISAPTTLMFPNHFSLKFASNFVENIIPLSFVDV